MFGMGFTEILFIAVIAILFLGPDKLPDAMVQIAKLFKSIKSTISEAKSSFEDEIHIKELREEALSYRKQFENASNDISSFKNSIPNPAAELQDAISSIDGDRHLDDDIVSDIKKAESRTQKTAILETFDIEAEDQEPIENIPVYESQEQPKKKKTKKSTDKPAKKNRSTAKKSKRSDNKDKA